MVRVAIILALVLVGVIAVMAGPASPNRDEMTDLNESTSILRSRNGQTHNIVKRDENKDQHDAARGVPDVMAQDPTASDDCLLPYEARIPGGTLCEGTCERPDGNESCSFYIPVERCGCNPDNGFVRSPEKGKGCINVKDCPKNDDSS